MVCTLQRKHDERYENTHKEALAEISSLVERCKTLERWHAAADSRDAAELERKKCKTLEREIAEIEEIV